MFAKLTGNQPTSGAMRLIVCVICFCSAPNVFGVALFQGSGSTLRNDETLTDPQLFRIIDAFAVGVENLFPSRRRTIKPPRDRGERIARLDDIGSRGGFVLVAFWTLPILCRRFVRQPRFRSALFQFFSQIEILVA